MGLRTHQLADQLLQFPVVGAHRRCNLGNLPYRNVPYDIANNGIDIHHDVATQMISFNASGNVSHSFDGDFGWSLTVQDGTDPMGDSEFRLETNGDADGFVTVIEEFGEVRGVTAIYSGEILRNTENESKIAWFWPILALVAFSILLSRDV